MDPKKVANNILEFMFDPTRIPVKERLYFRPEEILRNESFENAKADAFKAYGEERHNSDFYPIRNRTQTQREAALMDRKTLIASMDVLSQQFNESDPIGKDLRTMAFAVSKMSDEELKTRTVEAKKKVEFVECPKCGNKKVMKQTGYCLKCGTKGIGKDKKDDKKASEEVEVKDFWSKEASEAVQQAIIADVCPEKEDEEDEKDAAKKVEPEEEEKDAAKKKEPEEKEVSSAKKEEVVAAKKDDDKDEEKDAAKKVDDKDEEKDAAKKVDEEEKDAAKKVDEDEEKDAAKKVIDDEDEKDAAKKEKEVDTGILAYGGIEVSAGMVDVGELTADEKSKLDQLFQ